MPNSASANPGTDSNDIGKVTPRALAVPGGTGPARFANDDSQ
jgi:hypothetical protein